MKSTDQLNLNLKLNSYLMKFIKLRLNALFAKPAPTKSESFNWSRYLVNDRLRYKFLALKTGIEINKTGQSNLYNFRRNIHRIEKGLSYQETKTIFAEDYILETVECLERDQSFGFLDIETKKWGEAVLELYFQITGNSEVITEAENRYQKIKSKDIEYDRVPYQCSSRPALKIDYKSLLQLALRRRSVRFYLDKKVDPELVERALEVALQSPSACNRQSFKYLFFNQKEVVDKLSKIPGGVAGYSIPSVAVLIGQYRGYFDERDINAPIIDASLSAMAFLFALETLGLSSVCINWPNLLDREEKIRQVIHLEDDEFVIMLIGIGYPDPDGKIPYSAKTPVGNILSVNTRIL
jgi:nitroreductase